MDASKTLARCNELKRFWMPRDAKMKIWYKLIQMVDELAQTNMESFVGNDPRASFNILFGILNQRNR